MTPTCLPGQQLWLLKCNLCVWGGLVIVVLGHVSPRKRNRSDALQFWGHFSVHFLSLSTFCLYVFLKPPLED